MNKRVAWLMVSCLMVTALLLVSCAPAAVEEEEQEVVTEEEVIESQTRRVALGDFSYAYADYLEEMGVHRPRMIGPNLRYP